MVLIINKLQTVLMISAICFVKALYSQEIVKEMKVPMLKESYKIDSLFDTVTLQKISGPKVFSFTEISQQARFIILQREVKGSKIYLRLSKPQYMKKFGYFRYRECLVFVFRDYDTFGFFTDTDEARRFDFITKYHNEKEEEPGYYFFKGYEYRLGNFMEWSLVLH